MDNKKDNKEKKDEKEKKSYIGDKKIDSIDGRYSEFTAPDAIPGVNTPRVNAAGINAVGINQSGLALPAFNPPVPNRAWTAMRKGLDIDELSEEEKRELYYGRDEIF